MDCFSAETIHYIFLFFIILLHVFFFIFMLFTHGFVQVDKPEKMSQIGNPATQRYCLSYSSVQSVDSFCHAK